MQQTPLPQAPPTAPSITVKDPQISPPDTFHTYLITGKDRHGQFYVRRRFSDFLTLHQKLKRQWPGCYIPSLPNKKLLGNRQPAFVEHRRRFLHYFCSKIATIEHLYESEHVQMMLRYPDVEVDKALERIPEKSTATIVKRYEGVFGGQMHKTPMIDLNANIARFQEFVQRAEKVLRVMEQEAFALAEAKRQFQQCLNNTNIILLPGYQSQFLSNYLQTPQPNLHPITNDPDISESIRSLQIFHSQNSLDFFSDMLELELRELQVMARLVDSLSLKRQQCEKFRASSKARKEELSKLMSGKTTLKSVFNFSSKEEQIRNLQQGIQFQDYQAEALEGLIQYMVVIVGGVEIQRFKAAKRQEYYENVNVMSKMEIRNMAAYGALQRSIAIALNPLEQHINSQKSQIRPTVPKSLTELQQPSPTTQSSPVKHTDSQSSQQVKSIHLKPTDSLSSPT